MAREDLILASQRRLSLARSLETLVGMPRERFLERYWPHRAYVHHAPLSRLEHLTEAPELRDVESILRAGASADRIRVWFYERSKKFRTLAVSPEQASALYKGGHVTAVLDGFRIAPLTAWMAQLCRELETPIGGPQCNVYASTRNTGTKFHFDHCEVVLVQLRGRKTWRIAPNAEPNIGVEYFGAQTPLALLGAPSSSLQPNPAHVKTHVLRPGSVMFLPRGYWHASDTSASDSLALTLTFNSLTWAKLVAAYLTNTLSRDPEWREVAHGTVPLGKARPRAEHRFRELARSVAADLGDLDLSRTVQSAVGIYSAIPEIRLRVVAGVRFRPSASPPLLQFKPRRGQPVELALDDTTSAVWRAVARQKGAFSPADIAVPGAAPQVLGRLLESLLDAGVLVQDV